ncbi:hypothetical protein ACVIHF_000518 [Bradyrhizobium sp. USDA 4506]
MARSAGAFRELESGLSALQPAGEEWRFRAHFQAFASDRDNEYMMIDATIVRAHQHSAGARKKSATKRSAGLGVD